MVQTSAPVKDTHLYHSDSRAQACHVRGFTEARVAALRTLKRKEALRVPSAENSFTKSIFWNTQVYP